MLTERLILFGAGGHGKVVLSALLATGIDPANIYPVDVRASAQSMTLLGIPVAGETPDYQSGDLFHVAIGDPEARRRAHQELAARGFRPFSIVHPRAIVAPSAHLDDGVFVAALSIIGPEARVGAGSIVNHGAVVDHDCTVDAFAHIAPNATLGGGVSVGARTLVGSGAILLPGVRVGAGVVVGAGSVVRSDVADGLKMVGVPARSLL